MTAIASGHRMGTEDPKLFATTVRDYLRLYRILWPTTG